MTNTAYYRGKALEHWVRYCRTKSPVWEAAFLRALDEADGVWAFILPLEVRINRLLGRDEEVS